VCKTSLSSHKATSGKQNNNTNHKEQNGARHRTLDNLVHGGDGTTQLVDAFVEPAMAQAKGGGIRGVL